MSYSIMALDLEKLEASSPEASTIVRLMWGLNELNQFPHLGSLVREAEEKSPHLWCYFQGMMGTLIRLRISRVCEILDSVVRPIVSPEGPKSHPVISELLNLPDAPAELKTCVKELVKVFYNTDENATFKMHRDVRHRITDHFDHHANREIMREAMAKTVQQASSRSDDGILRGWIIQGDKNSIETSKISRFLLVDDFLTTAWRESILGVPFNPDGYDNSQQVRDVKDDMDTYMELFFTFASGVINAYLEKFNLAVDCDPNDLMTPPPDRPMIS